MPERKKTYTLDHDTDDQSDYTKVSGIKRKASVLPIDTHTTYVFRLTNSVLFRWNPMKYKSSFFLSKTSHVN